MYRYSLPLSFSLSLYQIHALINSDELLIVKLLITRDYLSCKICYYKFLQYVNSKNVHYLTYTKRDTILMTLRYILINCDFKISFALSVE